jgi:hypothetical protein
MKGLCLLHSSNVSSEKVWRRFNGARLSIFFPCITAPQPVLA